MVVVWLCSWHQHIVITGDQTLTNHHDDENIVIIILSHAETITHTDCHNLIRHTIVFFYFYFVVNSQTERLFWIKSRKQLESNWFSNKPLVQWSTRSNSTTWWEPLITDALLFFRRRVNNMIGCGDSPRKIVQFPPKILFVATKILNDGQQNK